ncbi:MAG: hypothetical protein JXD19_02165 [Deltaproteobacteria bacterium]|nr:hypothetical protein [Deltaproteobacteria bacterium]
MMHNDEDRAFDIRVVDKYIEKGSLRREDYEAYLKNLPDMSSKIDEQYRLEYLGRGVWAENIPGGKRIFPSQHEDGGYTGQGSEGERNEGS